MPICRQCGNWSEFSSSKISSETPYANPPLPLTANFNINGNLQNLEYTGNNHSVLDSAWEKPQKYFDVCGICGSKHIQWD